MSRLTYPGSTAGKRLLLSALLIAGGAMACLPAGNGIVSRAPASRQAESQYAPACEVPAGAPRNPRTIAEAVTLLNLLPKPTTVACFLEALERPFRIQATSSPFSVQPAKGTRSPRIFIFRGNLVISVVPFDEKAPHVEFGEILNPTMSIKGDLVFPVVAPLSTGAPFDGIRLGLGTSCRACHTGERALFYGGAPDTDVYSSGIIPPDPAYEVPVSDVVTLARDCDAAAEPQRCAILRAVVGESADVSRATF